MLLVWELLLLCTRSIGVVRSSQEQFAHTGWFFNQHRWVCWARRGSKEVGKLLTVCIFPFACIPRWKECANTWLARSYSHGCTHNVSRSTSGQAQMWSLQSAQKIHNNGDSTLKLSSWRFELTQDPSAPLLTLPSITPEASGFGGCHADIPV